MWAGAKYAVTDKLDVSAGYYHYIQNNFFATGPNTGCSSSAHSQCSGTFDAVSGVIDWRFAAKWDAYIGVHVLTSERRIGERLSSAQQHRSHGRVTLSFLIAGSADQR